MSTNGFFTDKIINLSKKYPDSGICKSIEGLEKFKDAFRKIPDGGNLTIEKFLIFRDMRFRDIGFGLIVRDLNYRDLL